VVFLGFYTQCFVLEHARIEHLYLHVGGMSTADTHGIHSSTMYEADKLPVSRYCVSLADPSLHVPDLKSHATL
jgi:hypothetical protein